MDLSYIMNELGEERVHGVVGCVHDVADGAYACEFEPALDLVRAGLDLHIPNEPDHKAWIQLRGGDFDFDQLPHRLTCRTAL